MPVETSLSEDKRRIVATYIPPVDFVEDVRTALGAIIEKLDHVSQFPAFVIIDISALTDLKFADIVASLGEIGTTPEGKKYVEYDTVTLYVGTHDLVKLTADALKQEQYGAYQFIQVVPSMAEAHLIIDDLVIQ